MGRCKFPLRESNADALIGRKNNKPVGLFLPLTTSFPRLSLSLSFSLITSLQRLSLCLSLSLSLYFSLTPSFSPSILFPSLLNKFSLTYSPFLFVFSPISVPVSLKTVSMSFSHILFFSIYLTVSLLSGHNNK